MIWFTADTHFGHKNILKYSNRPFSTIEEMDEALIIKWNSKVAADDEVYHLGDVGLCPPVKLKTQLNRLNGKIYLIKGNHEKSAEAYKERFEWIKDYFELIVDDPACFQGKQLVVLMHYAMRVWSGSHFGTYHLYGHSHGQLPNENASLSFDVGMDCHGYEPINYEDVKRIMKTKNWIHPHFRGK